MRHVVIYKRTADLQRRDLSEKPVASFLVGDNGIQDVQLGEDVIPRELVVFDISNGSAGTRVTLESDPIRWADLLSTAYRSGDYRVAVTQIASAEAADDLMTDQSSITAELEAVPH